MANNRDSGPMCMGIKMIKRTLDSFSSLCQKMVKVFYIIGGEIGTFILFLFYTNLFPVPPGRGQGRGKNESWLFKPFNPIFPLIPSLQQWSGY